MLRAAVITDDMRYLYTLFTVTDVPEKFMKGIIPMEWRDFLFGYWGHYKIGTFKMNDSAVRRCRDAIPPIRSDNSRRESESERIDDYENEVHFQNLNEMEWVPRHIKFTAISLKGGGRNDAQAFAERVDSNDQEGLSRFEYLINFQRSESHR